MSKPIDERIRRGQLMVVRTCPRCGGASQVNVTAPRKEQCIMCDVKDMQAEPGSVEGKEER